MFLLPTSQNQDTRTVRRTKKPSQGPLSPPPPMFLSSSNELLTRVNTEKLSKSLFMVVTCFDALMF